MQFLIQARDHTDPEALSRRLAVREDHIKTIDELKARGHMHMGAALVDDDGKMIGSVIICEFNDRAELDAWLAVEPYVTGKVWEKIEVSLCKVGPSFVK